MSTMPVVRFSKPLKDAKILRGCSVDDEAARSGTKGRSMNEEPSGDRNMSLQELDERKKVYQDVCLALQGIVARLNELYEEIFAGHNEAIARLSVEIARKVLMRNVRDGDYEIESMIKEALKNVPENSGLVVRLNPQDLEKLQTLQDAGDAVFKGLELTVDAAVGRAECVIESSKGIINVLIDEHLEQISKALLKTE